MSRVGKNPIQLPKGVEFKRDGDRLAVKGAKGTAEFTLSPVVDVVQDGTVLNVVAKGDDKFAVAMSGTTRALLNNMVIGVSQGFERKLELVGVGYRAQMRGKALGLTLGFSHPVDFEVPEGITIETPSQTEIMVRGANRQRVNQVAAQIRELRPPEPYKGKGVRYANEQVKRKEAKKK